MKKILNLIAVISLTISNNVFGQAKTTDSTKPSSLISFCSYREDKIEIPIHLDWVQTDKDIIQNKINKLPANGSTLSAIKKLIPHFSDGNCNCQSVTQDLGYGLKSTEHTIYGGYGSCNVDAIYFGDNVLKLRLTIGNHKEVIEKYLLDVIKLPFDCINGQISYEKTYEENIKKYLKDSGVIFLESADTNYRRRQAINYFTDVMTGGTFEKPFYITFGLGSETFDNLRFFIVNKDYQALESILFSPSPTSRLFAARTLIYMEDKFGYMPTANNDKRIKDVLKNAQLISSGILSCWMNKFEYDYYNIVKDFENLLLTQ
ncbi:MAG: hypothetical protein JST86_12255 [Bacteroidetes bacterium]|nr:hypothetical protein [Bacteroidota bacterium]